MTASPINFSVIKRVIDQYIFETAKIRYLRKAVEITLQDFYLHNEPLVSVCIPAFNATYISECIDSILRQTYHNFEIIVCDDSCDTRIKSVIREKRDNRIIYMKNKVNLGPRLKLKKCLEMIVYIFERYGHKRTLMTGKSSHF